MNWGNFIAGGSTAIAIIFGLSSWLGKVWANRILQQDKAKYKIQVDTLLQDLRTKNSKELFVHQLQFKKEFEIYKELWVSVLELDKAIIPLANDISFSNISNEEAHSNIRKAFKMLNEIIFINRPFYAPEIFEEAYKITELCQTICKCDQRHERLKNLEITEKTEKIFHENVDKLASAVDEAKMAVNTICNLIRQKIWNTNKTGLNRSDKD